CRRTSYWAHAMDCDTADRALIEMPLSHLPARQRQCVASLFAGEPQVSACFAPFGSVRRNAAPARSMMREQMRQFVFQRLLNFREPERLKPGIQFNQSLRRISQSGRALHSTVPAHAHLCGEILMTELSAPLRA